MKAEKEEEEADDNLTEISLRHCRMFSGPQSE